MPTRILIIDDSKFHQRLLERLVRSKNKDAVIESYDPVENGFPSNKFPWKNYDVLIMDYNLNNGTAFNWINTYHSKPGFPPTIIVTGEGSESLAVKAIKLGASDFLTKDDLNAAKLYESIQEALGMSPNYRPEAVTITDELMLDAETRRQLAEMDTQTGTVDEEVSTDPSGRNWAFDLDDILEDQTFIHDCRITGYIGKGSMATVYRAERSRSKEQVAVKLIHRKLTHDEKELDRFIDEFNSIAKVKHPGIVTVYDQGFTNEYAYMIMEYLPAGNLRNSMNEGISLSHSLDYAKQILSALDTLHRNDIVHRDLKPLNIIFRQTHQPVLVDFGIAKDLADNDKGLTTVGKTVGTPLYSSPEQIRGDNIDNRSDIYSFGVLFYEMLTRRRLFSGKTVLATSMMHLTEKPAPLPGELSSLQPLMSKLLAKKKENRYQSASDVLRDIEQISL